jgi:hypothetical protein
MDIFIYKTFLGGIKMTGLIVTYVIVLASILFLLGLIYYALRYIFRDKNKD